ncbi:mCG1027183 [Mus musculus]|nr:mCG1027183 [Mus musculus]
MHVIGTTGPQRQRLKSRLATSDADWTLQSSSAVSGLDPATLPSAEYLTTLSRCLMFWDAISLSLSGNSQA